MASIQKRISRDGTLTYRVRVRIKGRPIQTGSFRRLTDAKQWAQKTEAGLLDDQKFPDRKAQRHTLDELIGRYRGRILPAKSKGTQTIQNKQLDWWSTELGPYHLNEITPARIGRCREKLADGGLSPATINRYTAVLSHAFSYAMRELEWVDANPLQRVSKYREPRGRMRFLSKAERTALLDVCQTSDNRLLYPAVLLALATGMRQGEQMTLRWPQVDLATGRIVLEDTKNGERRTVIATGLALEELKRLHENKPGESEHLFPGLIPGRPIDLRAAFTAACKTAKLEDFRWHDLRHSFASELAMSGATLAEIAEAMGHKTLQMVKRYAHLTEGHIGTVVARMTEKVFGGEDA
ncbi:MAG: tyrosine-type recombinase/integrase [Leptospirillia bacterium]